MILFIILLDIDKREETLWEDVLKEILTILFETIAKEAGIVIGCLIGRHLGGFIGYLLADDGLDKLKELYGDDFLYKTCCKCLTVVV